MVIAIGKKLLLVVTLIISFMEKEFKFPDVWNIYKSMDSEKWHYW
jgi:hypothetical protein